MLLRDLVAASEVVAATSSRTAKIEALAELLRSAGPDEVEVAVAMLTGEPRQGRIGVGWRTVANAGSPTEATAGAGTRTVGDVDRAIDELAAMSGSGSAAARRKALAALFDGLTAPERDFLVQLFTGGLRQGALDGVMAEAVARAAGVPSAAVRRAAMLAGDLPHVAGLALGGGAAALDAVGLTVMRPVLPMLASTASSTAEAIAGLGLASVEWKLDGVRVQAHRSGEHVALYTRNLNDVTERLPSVAALVRELPTSTIILDGEVLGVSEAETGPELFQATMSRFGNRAGRGAGLEVRFFDVLHRDGLDLLDAPLTERRRHLEEIAGPWCIPAVLTADADTAAAMLDDALAAGHEGVMVKGATTAYEAGRRGKAWRKVKPVVTLDLVVLGAEWGHGRRRGWLSNLHLGARDPKGGFVMVGKTFKGLTDELLTWQTEAFLARETAREGITVFVRPELIVEIAVDGVQRSTRYTGGVALRFARVRRYRADKDVSETDTIDAVRALLPSGDR